MTRAIALIGVVTMNYHGMMNFPRQEPSHPSLVDRLFHIDTGILSTRFAAVFVVVAGIGATLLARSPSEGIEPHVTTEVRVRLMRRGAVLLVSGYLLDLVWPGSILFHYGAFFILAAFVVPLRTRALATLSAGITLGTLFVSTWRRSTEMDSRSTAWMDPADIESFHDLVARLFLGYTHPILPWFSFFLGGMILGRSLDRILIHWRKVSMTLGAIIVATYLGAHLLEISGLRDRPIPYIVSSMQPNERGLGYTVSTMSIALLAVVLVSVAAETTKNSTITVALRRSGQLSLSLYLGHVLFYYMVVEWPPEGPPTGLGTALWLSVAYWLLAITAGSWWHHRIGPGPAERVYRWLGG